MLNKNFKNELEFEEIPTIEDVENWTANNRKKTSFIGDKLILQNCGEFTKVFICHREKVYTNEEGLELKKYEAYSINVSNPIRYSKCINEAEKKEYDINDGEMIAIARKYRINPNDEKVVAHDVFIDWIKAGLKEIGITY